MLPGIQLRRGMVSLGMYIILVLIPYGLHAAGITSIAVLLNPFTVFFVMFFAVLIGIMPYIPKNPTYMMIFLFFVALGVFLYVWTLYISQSAPIPVIPSV